MAPPIELMHAAGGEGPATLKLAPAGKTWEKAPGAPAFSSAIGRAVDMLVQPQRDAAQAVTDFAQGADGELHKSMLTLERADITLKYFVNMRNKALEAYREIMHMGS